MTTNINWKEFADLSQWQAAYSRISADLKNIPWLQAKVGKMMWSSAIPPRIHREIRKVAAWTGYPVDVVMAAQVVYDEAWNFGGDHPLMGCTSVSYKGRFGRNLDYGYPENAADLVYHATIPLADKECLIEGFAGLLSFLAITDSHVAVSLNQAPSARPLRRHRIPGLLWFRSSAENLMSSKDDLSDFGDVWLANPPASDVLLHYVIGNKSYIAETHDKQMMWKKMSGKVVQTNAYQLIDVRGSEQWEVESAERAAKARAGRSIPASLRAAYVDDWTIDTIILK